MIGVFRLLHILRVSIRHGMAHVVVPKLATLPLICRMVKVSKLPGPERLRVFFEDLGGTFVKFGQMLALQPDILSTEYCNALFKLLDKVDPFAYSEVERILIEELGRPPEEIFDSIEHRQLATASVGQVHVAYLNGQKVAVKVQRPNVEAEFWSDIRLMTLTMRCIRGLRFKPLYWMLEPMGEFVGWTQEELDYRNEARYAEEIRSHRLDTSKQYVPRVFTDYSTRRVLVVEFLDGITLLDYLRAREQGDQVLLRRLESRGFDRSRFASNVIDNFLGDAFRHGIYHADLHPANLMILENNVVGYIDFGITGVMSHYSRRHMMEMTLALAQGDTENLVGKFWKLSAKSQDSQPELMRRRLEALIDVWYHGQEGRRRLQVSFTQVCRDFLAVSRETGVLPERDIIKYIRSAIAIDGLCSRFEPDFHIGQRLAVVCARQIYRQQLGAAVSHERLMAQLDTGRRLLVDGPSRMWGVFDQLSKGEIPVRAQAHRPGRGHHSGRGSADQALMLGAMVLVLAILLTTSGEPPSWGLNLFTAELSLAAIGLARLLTVLHGSADRGPVGQGANDA